jgi:hypothetical protein
MFECFDGVFMAQRNYDTKSTNRKKSFDKTPEELYIYIIEVEINFIFVVGIKLSVNVLKLSTLALKSITDNIKQNTNET